MKKTLALAVLTALVALGQLPIGAQAPAVAQDYSLMSCGQLWYARNKIYADAGYCFKTVRARREFGAGCFPPYGQLSAFERRRINQIQYWESQNGCR